MKNIWLFIFASMFLKKGNCEIVLYPEEIEFCAEKIGKNSHCVQITKCTTSKDDIKQGKRPEICGFSGEMPLVCCLTSAVLIELDTTSDLLCGRSAHIREDDNILYNNDSYVQGNESERLTINTDGSFIIQPRILRREKFRVGSQDWPWMIAIYSKSNGSFVCNGFLIDSSHLLTAAHCFHGKRRQSSDYYVGMIYNEGKMSADVTDMHIHPDYNSNYYKDIALLKISPPMTNSVSICMPSGAKESDYLLETDTVILDWVGTEYVVQRNKLAEMQLCDQLYTNLTNSPFPKGITNELMCAVPTEKSNYVCQVHSGGPVMTETNGKWMAIGIATFGIPCTLPTYPAVYTRISPYLEWIRDNK